MTTDTTDTGFERAERLAALRGSWGRAGAPGGWPEALERRFRRSQREHRRRHRTAVFLLPWLMLGFLPGVLPLGSFTGSVAGLVVLGTAAVLLLSAGALASLLLNAARPTVQRVQALAVGVFWLWLLGLRHLSLIEGEALAVPAYALGLAWVLTALLAGFAARRLIFGIGLVALPAVLQEALMGGGDAAVTLLVLSAAFAIWAAANDERLYRALWLEQETSRALTRVDPLTGLANRLEWFFQLSRSLALARREKRPLALILIDLDDFHGLNDRCGHLAGDEMLRQVGQQLQQTQARRPADVLARIGTDQFALALYGAEPAAVDALSQQIWRQLRTLEVQDPHRRYRERPRVSLVAVVMSTVDGWTPDSLQALGEGVMRELKAGGGDQTRLIEGGLRKLARVPSTAQQAPLELTAA